MSYEIGVLLYHCTEYGHADFDIQGCVEALLNALSNRVDVKEAKRGFIAEVSNYWDEENEDKMINAEALFVETWNDFIDEENLIKK